MGASRNKIEDRKLAKDYRKRGGLERKRKDKWRQMQAILDIKSSALLKLNYFSHFEHTCF